MKVKPVILCGGEGTRLFPNFKNIPSKQFIDFGGWTLFGNTLDRIKNPIFDSPIISTNKTYEKLVRIILRKNKIKKFKIILEPHKKNTAPAIICSTLISDIKINQPVLFLPSDHYLPEKDKFNKILQSNLSNLNSNNIFIFSIKPNNPSTEYGYVLSKKISNKVNKVTKFIEKPKEAKAKQVIKQKGYWNSGMFFLRKDSIINNFKKYQPIIYKNCLISVQKAKFKENTYYLNKPSFIKATAKSFDYAILEKTKLINAIKLDIPWSDLGSWKEILKMFNNNKNKYYEKKNFFNKPWGSYVNLFKGKDFLVKELLIKPKGILSLQKHHHRAEHWLITQGNPKITLNNKYFIKNPGEHIFIPLNAIHRIENPFKKQVKIIEAQVGSILKETDIVRYKDIYGRV